MAPVQNVAARKVSVVEMMGCACSRHCTDRARQSFATGGKRWFDFVSAKMSGSCLLIQFVWAKLQEMRRSATIDYQAVFVVADTQPWVRS